MDALGIGAVANLASGIISRIFPDKTAEEQAKLAAALTELQGQLDANKAEAASQSIFVAGWRPFVGWVCGAGFGIAYVIGPMLEWMGGMIGHPIKFPTLDLGSMMPLLLGMLGMGSLRSFDKSQGAGNGH